MSTESTHTVQAEGARSEAFRSLRSTIKFAAGDAPIRSVLIVDADRNGPSDTAREVAHAFAQAGDRCAWVDADFRAGGGTDLGFSDVLAGTVSLDAVLKGTSDAPGYATVAAGSASNPDLLAGDQLPVALEGLLQRFEYVILSTASLPAHSDALSLAARVDAVVLAVTSGKSRRPRAIEARDALNRVGARVLGVVLIETRRRLFW